MLILFLSPHKHLIPYLKAQGDTVRQTVEPLHLDDDNIWPGVNFIISYGYRYKVHPLICEHFKGRAINLHISYLPWNRGADPNLWSFLEDTPKGVTIHLLDEGIDTGDILVQRKVGYNIETDTLRTTYNRLTHEIERLFKEKWPEIRAGTIKPMPQMTCHRLRDKEGMNINWDMPIKNIIGAKERLR